MLENILLLDYEIETAENGFRGMERVLHGSQKIDCILLDLHMPVMNGFGVLELLRDCNINDIPVIIISTESTSENLYKTFSFNAADFICKPFDPQIVIERVDAVLKRNND